jgi:catechol 2,3-dioxygenase-like lactoylglutathione lyase family enzyme
MTTRCKPGRRNILAVFSSEVMLMMPFRARSTATLAATIPVAAVLMLGIAASAQAPATPPAESVRAVVSQNSMNVFRRFPPELRDKMVEYYGKVLALRSLSPITLGGGNQMILFGVGTGQVKLASGLVARREFRPGPVKDATGIRVITLFFPDEAALVERFKASGYPAPQFQNGVNGARHAMVADPGGFITELVVVPNGQPSAYARIEVGITVSDLEKSRAFYREFVGLDELPAVKDVVLGVTKYPYRHGETTVNLWSFGKGLPADTGSAGIQYVVSNVDLVDTRAKARNVTVETPLGDMAGFSLRTVWLNDPDGVTNYFAQVGGARGGRGPQNTTR